MPQGRPLITRQPRRAWARGIVWVGRPSQKVGEGGLLLHGDSVGERDRWDVGLPAEIDQIMAKTGVGIYPPVELGPSE
eukprot:3946087-Prymnesium_polylepis.1